jgi:hypothetical protein
MADEVKTPQPATLSDLECATINVAVSLADGEEVTIALKLIPQYRMMQLANTIPQPTLAVADFGAGGKPITTIKTRSIRRTSQRLISAVTR